MTLTNLQTLPIPPECKRLERLFLASDNETKFFQEIILKNLFSLEKHESVTLVLYPTGHIDLKDLPKEMFETVEKILKRKAEEKIEVEKNLAKIIGSLLSRRK